jgi:GNAT superfamily N-acetyltransferase
MAKPNLPIRGAAEADLPAIAAVHLASWQEAYRGLVPQAVLFGRSIEGCHAGWRLILANHPEDIALASTPDGRVHGFCYAGPVVDSARSGPFEFEIYGLHVAPSARRQGFGASLLHRALARAHRAGMRSAIVWTLEGLKPSRRFYEREGGKPVKSGFWSIDGVTLPEIAYGWTELCRFAGLD